MVFQINLYVKDLNHRKNCRDTYGKVLVIIFVEIAVLRKLTRKFKPKKILEIIYFSRNMKRSTN